MISWHMARRSAASVPGHGDSHQSAIDAVLLSRVSIAQIFAPRFFPSMIRWACGLK